jgi:hypothetical protein
MAKDLFKRYMPQFAALKDHPKLKFFGRLLHDPRLWHFNRHSLAGGMGIGLFAAFLPMPLQMFLAAALSIFFRVNLPLAVSLVWISNPFTMPPIIYVAYQLGAWVLGENVQAMEFSLSSEWVLNTLSQAWLPFIVGSFMLSILSGIVGYIGVQMLWRIHVRRAWKQRQLRRISPPSSL